MSILPCMAQPSNVTMTSHQESPKPCSWRRMWTNMATDMNGFMTACDDAFWAWALETRLKCFALGTYISSAQWHTHHKSSIHQEHQWWSEILVSGRWHLAQKVPCAFPLQLVGWSRRNESSRWVSQVGVSDLSSLQCTDTVGSVTGRTSGAYINLHLSSQRSSLREVGRTRSDSGKDGQLNKIRAH